MDKAYAAEILRAISVMLEIKGENPFKTRAYHRAANALSDLNEDLETLVAEGRLSRIPGIGKALEEKITQLVRTGKLDYFHTLRNELPGDLWEFLTIPGLGPKKIGIIYRELKVDTLETLEAACRLNKLLDLEGFGKRTQEKILQGIVMLRTQAGSHLHIEAAPIAEAVCDRLARIKHVRCATIAGSLRRGCETIKDLHLVVLSDHPRAVLDACVKLPEVEREISRNKQQIRAHVQLAGGILADISIADEAAYPFLLHHATGSKEHCIALAKFAKTKGFRMTGDGLWDAKGALIACKSEQEIFEALGLKPIPPEIREDTGEIEAACKDRLPKLIQVSDIKGVLHNHSDWSDGRASIKEMAETARDMGMSYFGTGDHSRAAAYAGGLTEKDVIAQGDHIRSLQNDMKDIQFFWGIEADILKTGEVDYSEDILERFDYVVASIHTSFGLLESEMTQRVIRAMENPFVTMLGHPTGRLLGQRNPYAINMHAVLDAAADLGVMVEINANPRRLDLDWHLHSYAVSKGVMLVINPDAHHPASLSHVWGGVSAARKGWLRPLDVLNTRLPQIVKKILQAPRTKRRKLFDACPPE